MARASLQTCIIRLCLLALALPGGCAGDTDAPSTAQPSSAQSGAGVPETGSRPLPGGSLAAGQSGAGAGVGPMAGSASPPPAAAGVAGSSAAGAGDGAALPAASGAGSAGAAVAGSASLPIAGSPAQIGSAGAMAGSGPQSCTDSCAVAAGVRLDCKLRFMYGANYAWHTFAGDFGGIKAWNQAGVSAEPAVDTDLAAMAAGGVQVLRWWLWPDFRGDGVAFDASDTPTGLGGSALADLSRALELADKHDMYLMLTIFSFDNFRATRMESTLRVRGIKPIVTDEQKRRALMDKVIAPLARAVAASPHARRVIAWDMINEPEWAINGASLYGGDPAFDPQTDLESVSHAQMETFLRDTLQTLRANSKALVTVGATAIKWKSAWSKLDLDFHQFHMYDWINMYWPYDRSPMAYMLDDKPVVMGEFPMKGLTGVSYSKLLESWFGNAYGGALAWAYTDPMFSGMQNLSEVKAFSGAHACETRY